MDNSDVAMEEGDEHQPENVKNSENEENVEETVTEENQVDDKPNSTNDCEPTSSLSLEADPNSSNPLPKSTDGQLVEAAESSNDQFGKEEVEDEEYTPSLSISVSTTLVNPSSSSVVTASLKASSNNISQPIQVSTKKTIFTCYSPEASFEERKIVVETVQELSSNGLSEIIWLDKAEMAIDTCCWMAQCAEMAEKCRAALLFVSEGFFACSQSLLLSQILLERLTDPNAIGQLCVYTAIVSPIDLKQLPKAYHPLFERYIDLTAPSIGKSIAEKVSAIVGVFSIDLEYFADTLVPPTISDSTVHVQPSGRYKVARILSWKPADVQEWLQSLNIREFYRQSLAEWMMDGFLLIAMTDRDMTDLLEIDSRAVRKKLTSQIVVVMEKEHRKEENWHLRCRSMRSKPNSVYLIFDPADARLAQTLKRDLSEKGFFVTHQTKLGQSREEFLKSGGPGLAQAKYMVVLVTENSCQSPFFRQEIMFSQWLGKPIITALFKNVWHKFGYLLKGTLGDCPSIDFATKLYEESLGILENALRPIKTIPGLILEQSYVNKVTEGLRPLRDIINASVPSTLTSLSMTSSSRPIGGGRSTKSSSGLDSGEPSIFISFQWDMASRAKEIKRFLEHNGFPCWTDVDHERIVSGRSTNQKAVSNTDSETLQSHIQRSMKAAQLVICCVTPKYVQSDNCLKDLTLADLLRKPILPLMLRFCPWPPEGTPPPIKRILNRLTYVDLSNPKFNKQNMAHLLERVYKAVGSTTS